MHVKILLPELIEAYDQYLLRNSNSLFYYSTNYKNFLKELLGCQEEYLLAMEDNVIYGILPLMYTESVSGRVYNSLPYYGSNGGMLSDNIQAHNTLLRAYNEIANSKGTISSTVISNPLVEQKHNDFAHNYLDYRIGQFTQLSNVTDNWEELLGRIESSARRNVNKALREGVSVEVDHNQLDHLYEIHQDNIMAIGGMPKAKDFFKSVSQYFIPGKDFDLYVAKKDGVIIAILLLFYFNKTVEYFVPATKSEFRSIQPLALILINAMTNAARRGFVWWNWGGTWASQTGVYRFKKKWAAMELKYSYYTQLNDQSILNWAPEKILKAFPNFFVVPFHNLNNKEAQDE